ncbi:hypothetical protein PBY51_007162 [Eleginops maclovinus]|uniref:Uncharacterized protein n=1 Tax=Eleginops maclovinus TaxID=56733 RepID=A0AAN7X2K9_ELEMC|nr:hypothetical protein PBY51_007162 [Eleginops maclovinus]
MTSTFELEAEQQGDWGQVGVGLSPSVHGGNTPPNEKPGNGVPVRNGMEGAGRAKEEQSDRFKHKTEGSGRQGGGLRRAWWKWLSKAGFTEFS